jgi:hypothetical protein
VGPASVKSSDQSRDGSDDRTVEAPALSFRPLVVDPRGSDILRPATVPVRARACSSRLRSRQRASWPPRVTRANGPKGSYSPSPTAGRAGSGGRRRDPSRRPSAPISLVVERRTGRHEPEVRAVGVRGRDPLLLAVIVARTVPGRGEQEHHELRAVGRPRNVAREDAPRRGERDLGETGPIRMDHEDRIRPGLGENDPIPVV